MTETWLCEEEVKLLKIDNYKIGAFYCRSNSRGGGVSILVREDLYYKVIKLNPVSITEKIFEGVALNICFGNLNVTVGCIYRSPGEINDTFIEITENFLSLLTTKVKNKYPLFICGDFNCNFLNKDDNKVSDILNVFSSYGLCQCFSEYSRIYGTSKTQIDNVFSNIGQEHFTAETVSTDLSDHCAQILSVQNLGLNTVNRPIFTKKRVFSEENLNHLLHLLSCEDWLDVYSTPSSKNKFKLFFDTFSSLFNIAYPLINSKHIQTPKIIKPWITKSIIEEGNLLKNIHKLTKTSNDPELKSRYKSLKKKHEKNIETAKIQYNDAVIDQSKNKSKAAWAVIKNNINYNTKNTSIPDTIVTKNNEIVNDGQNMADIFNNNFIDSISNLTSNFKNYTENIGFSIQQSIFLSPLTVNEVKKIIISVTNKNSAGYDQIPCSLLRKIADYLLVPLTYLINLSFETGYFPEQLKIALVIPVHKRDDPRNPENYRPIALLSVFSKIFEKAFLLRLNSFLDRYDILTSRQYGFRKSRSTQDAIVSFYNKILDSFDKHQKSAGIFFDLSKAFDTINHKLLLQKLNAYGIRGSALEWLKSYLSGRTQSVQIIKNGNIFRSESVNITTGVPQGSILGPVLFIIFINDAANYKNCFLTLFADDTSAIITSENVTSLSKNANTAVNYMSDWCNRNGLALNAAKTNLMLFSPTGIKPDISILVRNGAGSIQQNNVVKFLGIQMDNNLTWEPQIETLCKRLSIKNFAVIQLRTSVSFSSLKAYYYGCIHSILCYGILCWGNSSYVFKVFLAQKRIVRSMFRLPYNSSCRAHFQKHGIMTVYCIYILQCLCHVRKNIDTLKKCGEVNKYLTRNSKNLYVPFSKLTQVNKGPTVNSIRLYNSLPNIYKEFNDYDKFKKAVTQFLKKECFYSITEYYNYCNNWYN